jgi:hypothetical protein
MKAPLLLTCALLSACASTSRDSDDTLVRMLNYEAPRGTLSATQRAEIEKHPLGSAQNPVLAEGPPGERAYLMRLRCPEGKAPTFERTGSAAQMSPYGSIMDIYQVACDAPPTHTIYIDMYHRGHAEARPVAGFTIISP